MTTDVLNTVTHLINSPPGQLAAGGVLIGFAWKVFERVENVLNEDAKLEIAVWLSDIRLTDALKEIPRTAGATADRILGSVRLSWGTLLKLTALTCALGFLNLVIIGAHRVSPAVFITVPPMVFLSTFASMSEIRLVVRAIRRTSSPLVWFLFLTSSLIVDFCGFMVAFGAYLGFGVGADPAVLWHNVRTQPLAFAASSFQFGAKLPLLVLPSLVPEIVVWTYAGSGLVLKAARRFDIGFDWFNRHFDIEKKPLQSIGLVAGVLVAVVYWTAAIVSRVVG